MIRRFTICPSNYINASQSIYAYGGYGTRHPHQYETEEHYRDRQMDLKRMAFEEQERQKKQKSPFRRYKMQSFVPTQEDYDSVDALVEEYRDSLDIPREEPLLQTDGAYTQLGNCPQCGGTILDNGRCAYCGAKVYNF